MKTIFISLIILMFLGNGFAYAGPYTSSAHGGQDGAITGVLRTSTNQYATGNCAHCHEQHASIAGTEPAPNIDDVASFPGAQGPDNYLLFDQNHYDQTHNFCFDCHGPTTAYTSGLTNYNYSRTFGGDTSAAPDDIKEAFGLSGSVHDLADVLTKISGWGHFDSNSNPCSGCHNPHLVQRNFDSYDAGKSALSRPNTLSNHNELWGDTVEDADKERMNEYAAAAPAAVYRAPFYVGADSTSQTTAHEPDGADYLYSNANGSNLTNFVTFCLDCHSEEIGGSVSAIDWSSSGDDHGKGWDTDGTGYGNRMAPYTKDSDPNTAGTSNGVEANDTNFVLSCMDCHEPHGSSNCKLLRTEVNKKTGISVSGGTWKNFCDGSCHSSTHKSSSANCSTCHYHGNNF